MPKTSIVVKGFGRDGNAFALMGQVTRALKRGGRADLVAEFGREAMSGNYDHLLQTCLDYVEVEMVDDDNEVDEEGA